jgi:anti-sigma-K factor RskA
VESGPRDRLSLDHATLQERAAPYVLGALPLPERTAFEAHLAICADCAAEVRSLDPIAALLASAAPPLDPPMELRDRILTSLAANRPVGHPTDRRGSAVPWWLGTAAALAVIVGLGGYVVQLRGRVRDLEVRLVEATLRAGASERQIADLRQTASYAQSSVAVLTAPDVARVDLAGQPVAPRASARAFWSRSRGLVFTASNLPPLPAGRTYQLWVLTTAPAPTSAGLLKPDGTGRVTAVFTTPADLPRPVAMAVTIEPEGGVPAPTGDKYLVGLAG